MSKKRFFYIFGVILGSLLFLSSCNNSKTDNDTNKQSDVNEEDQDQRYQIYLLAKQSGYTGTYEEWLNSIRGDSVELRVSSGYLQWKYKKADEWINLINLFDLATGTSGSAREIEMSATQSHIIWRYVGETTWRELLDISNISKGKSAYEIAREAGFTGTQTEWLESLKGTDGRGIAKIEKIKTEGLVDYYLITFTDNTTYEFQITNGKNGSSSGTDEEEEIPEELVGMSFQEILGMGYSLTSIHDPGENVIIPSEYKGKPVVEIGVGAIYDLDLKIKNLYIPNTIAKTKPQALGVQIENLYIEGDLDILKLINNSTAYKVDNVFILDELGSYTFNGKKFSPLEEITISNNDDMNYIKECNYTNFYTIFDKISNVTISETWDIKDYLFLSHINSNLDNIYFDGTLDKWFKLKMNGKAEFNNLYVLNPNGNVTHNGKKYNRLTELDIPNDFANALSNYLPKELESITFAGSNYFSYSSYYQDFTYFVENYSATIYYDGDYYELPNTIKTNYANYIYILSDKGTLNHNNKKYILCAMYTPDTGQYTNISKAVWDPISLSQAQNKYTASGTLDTWVVYSKIYGPTYNEVLGTEATNPIDGITYKKGDLLPAWKEFAQQLGLTSIQQGGEYGSTFTDDNNFANFKSSKDASGAYIDKNGRIVDLFYNNTTNLNELADDDELVDLTPYINNGLMPALKKFLDDNPSVKNEITHNGKIFYTPYLDGFQEVERSFQMDTEQVEKLLDNTLPTGTGNLVAGAAAPSTSKGLKGYANVTPFINNNYNYPDEATQILIVNPKTNGTAKVTVRKTTNIIKAQNTLLNSTDGYCTGKALIDQFKAYAREAYGDIIDTYYDGKISKMFTSVGACYNTDDLIALLRIFKANPDVLYGSNSLYDEVIPVFPRGQANNRAENILNFAATLYGVQGRGSEYDHLFFGADGKIHDFDTQQASYDMLDRLHDLYTEGLIQSEFWKGNNGTRGLESYFKKNIDGSSTFGLLEYDYIATQSAANDMFNGFGTKSTSRQTSPSGFDFSKISIKGIRTILSPLTYVSTETYNYSQNLDDKTGKSLNRYYEENRSVKNTSWSIPKSSDNINSAIALMDLMFTKEGWETQNFGPSAYWDYGTILEIENTPIFKQSVLDHFSNTEVDFWNYCRGFLGTTQGIGHYRPVALDYQATNIYAKEGYYNLVLACNLGVQLNSRAVGSLSEIKWNASMPMACFSLMDTAIANTYAGVTTFWSQNGKVSASGTKVGWIMIMVEGSDYSSYVLTDAYGNNYTYTQVKAQIDTKNKSYLYSMGNKLNLIAPEAIAT